MTSAGVPRNSDSHSDSHADPRTQERVGQLLDEKWTLERILGSGGMGAVYAARHRNGARAAVKVLHPELARRADVRERFLREGYAANRVEHRGAVRVLDDDTVKEGPDQGTAYLVMEILEGESLEERLERGPKLTELELLGILNDVLAVLEAAHANGVVHRDLKPANLFLNKDPAGPGVKVLDFGLARLEELRSVTGVGLALGTPSFMAPEQANGRTAEIDARTDIFAVGATAFMILAGRGVHEADGVLELVGRMGTLPAPKLREVAPEVSEPVAAIVDRAVAFNRDDRYPSATAMRAEVQAAASALAPPAETTAPPASARSRIDEPLPSANDAGRPRRSLAPYVLALLVAAGLVLVLVPQARERAGMPTAVTDLFSSSASLSASPSRLLAPPPASASSVASASASASAPAFADDPPSSSTDVVDASSDAGDAGDAGDDDDDDDDVDASDVAAIIAGHDGGASSAVHPGAAKHPRVRVPRHGRPPRKRRRPRR